MRITPYAICWTILLLAGCADSDTPFTPSSPPEVNVPPLPEPTTPEAGVHLHEVTLRRGDSPMKVWIYLPAEKPQGKIPCVLIAPAGTPLFIGMQLAEGDQAEHWPYVREGFAVVSYELDGHVSTPLERASDAELFAAAKKFRAANAGVANARAALDYALARVPAIDADRIYAVGHSSAATLALLVASQEPRIDACVAFAPVTDVPGHLSDGVSQLDRAMPGFESFLNWSSPNSHAAELKCPVILFHSEDDTTVDISESTKFAEQLKPSNSKVKLIRVEHGGHYESMIDEGVPQAIRWLKGLPE